MHLVSVVMPVRNMSLAISGAVWAAMAQDYPPHRMEILIVDGMSEDGTRDIIRSMLESSRAGTCGSSHVGTPRIRDVKVIDNPLHIIPSALNASLKRAKGDIIIRVDGHCEIAPDYVRRCVEVLQETGADCVGGPSETVGETLSARAIALAQSSQFGVGGVAFRTRQDQSGYEDTVPFGAYRREVFSRIGVFDEELVCNEDDEFNFRLIQAGGTIWLDPSIRCVYHCRTSLQALWRQYFQYGFYKVRVIQKRGGVASSRHLVPGAFVLPLLGSLVLALFTRQPLWALSVVGPYSVANVLNSLWTARRDLRTFPILPIAFATIHFAYGLGFLSGLRRWRQGWRRGRGHLIRDEG